MPDPNPLDSRSLTQENFRHICEMVLREAAIVLGTGKEYLVEARLSSVASRHHYPTLNALVDHLRFSRTSGPLQREIVDALTTNETLFFRDFHPFEALKKDVLPVLLDRHRDGPIIIWSAACSSGQEAYSLAMLIEEHFPRDAARFQIIGTDISTHILRRARAGVYQQLEVNRGLPAALLVKYFKQISEGWELREDIRRRVEFRELNLSRPWSGMPRCHLVMMRNVMIYFDVAMRRQILGQVSGTLMPDCYLLLGGAETTMMVDDSFSPLNIGRTTFYKNSRNV